MVDRIKQVMDYEQMSPTAFADKININRSSLTHIFSGRNQPSLDVAKKILKAFPEISTEWLIMGMGNMLQPVPEAVETPVQVKTVDNMQQTDLFSGTEDDVENDVVTPEPVVDSVNKGEDVEATSVVPESPSQVEDKVSEVAAPAPRPVRGRGRTSESNNSGSVTRRDRISNSQSDKKLVKIVLFYEDRSFEEYRPS